MNVWDILHWDIDKNLLRLHDAQAQAEERGDETFPCPVCGGEVRWIIGIGSKLLICCCKRCGMFLRGLEHETM